MFQEYEVATLGAHRNTERFYKQGQKLAKAGFTPGSRFMATVDKPRGMVVFSLDPKGTFGVSKKGDNIPVVDVNNRDTLSIFSGMDRIRVVMRQGQIYLLALATEVRRKERLERINAKLASDAPIEVGSISHGAGILSHALHAGLADAGIAATLKFANDIEGSYLDQAQAHNDSWDKNTIPVVAPMQEFAMDEWGLRQIGSCDVFEGGIPCTAASVAGRAKKGLEKPEDDRNVGHLMFSYLTLVGRLNPLIAILENVPQYQNTASMAMFRSQMSDMGYEVHEAILEGQPFGAIENRKRMVAVAVTTGMKMDFMDLEMPLFHVKSVADILDPIGPDDPMWSPMTYLKDKEVRDAAKGSSFKRQEVVPTDTSIPTITRQYIKRRSTDPMLVHPENPDLLRLFTPGEHARAKGVPEHLIAGMSATKAHEVLGQGICHAPFRAVGKLIGNLLKRTEFDRIMQPQPQQPPETFALLAA